MFKRNVGILDRIVRVALGVVFLPVGLFWLSRVPGSIPGLIITILGTIGLFTGLTGFCLLYPIFGITTLEMEKDFIARCMSMMSEFRRGPDGRQDAIAEQSCGPCLPMVEES